MSTSEQSYKLNLHSQKANPDFHCYRLVEMYHSGCMSFVRENVIASFYINIFQYETIILIHRSVQSDFIYL